MVTIEVVDPITGERLYLAKIERGGKVYYQRLKRSIYDPTVATARELEARAALAESAATAYGQKSGTGEPVAWDPVRKHVPRTMQKYSAVKASRRERTQRWYSRLVDSGPVGASAGPRVEFTGDRYVLYSSRTKSKDGDRVRGSSDDSSEGGCSR